jgi:DNA-binding MarR family transcriptional regulator
MKNDNTVELVEMIFKVSRLMKEEMSFTNNLVHLSILQIQTLFFLNKNKTKKISMSDIAGHFNVELPSATSLLNKLYEMNLVERHADEQDRRLVLITVTAQGEKMLQEAMLHRRKNLEKMLSYLSVEEVTNLKTIFETLNSKLQKQNET